MLIKNNQMAAFAQRELNIVGKQKSAERLSSGYRINQSADDAAGLTISEKLRWQMRGLSKSSKNIQDGISLLQVADGALNETHAVLQKMRELAVQAANDTNTDADREAIVQEMKQMEQEVDKIAKTTNFNGDIYPIWNTQTTSGTTATGWELPTYLSIREIAVQNTTTSTVKWDGVEYSSGETFWVKYVAYNATKNSNSNWKYLNGAYRSNGGCGEVSNITSVQDLDKEIKEKVLKTGGYSVTSWGVEGDGIVYFNATDGARIYYAVSDDGNSSSVGVQRSIYCDYYFKAVAITSNQGSCDPSELWIQTGSMAGQGVSLRRINATADVLGIVNLNVNNYKEAGKAIVLLDYAIQQISSYRSEIGALQNRLEYARRVSDNTAENTQAAESVIRDSDMAKEMLDYSKHSILEQAGQAMLTQANESMQGVLGLLQQK